MEVVLSPGRFGDEAPGAPFQNEEIREWSHVDRLTGMLERARVETGRWKTLNQGAARTYGKVIDSRERNSADGSVVQRARRQVEVFQSEGPGRSVQVVRASQWSSSRVTDSSTTSPLAVASSLAQRKKNGAAAAPERSVGSSRLKKLSPSSSLCRRDEAISERLSTLLGSFAHHTSSSTVPFRRIDSKYASRTPISLLPISKRSTSSEDLTGHNAIHGNGFPAATRSSRDFQYPSCREIDNRPKDYQDIRESSPINPDDRARRKLDEISVDRQGSGDHAERPRVHEISVERGEESKDHNERPKDCEDSRAILENSQSAIASTDEPRTTTNKAAIQLLPSSKANTTVVNLINDSTNSQLETMDTREGKGGNIYSWILPSSIGEEEAAARVLTEEATTPSTATTAATTTAATTTTTTTTTTTAPSHRRDSRVEESTTSLPTGRSVKRVGFCKTEIHFAADSGKVNIVETDGKPPPTNKFRRRRRNSLTGVASGKPPPIEIPPVVETRDSLPIAEDGKSRTDPNLHRGHTTTVNLGSGIADLAAKNQPTNRENVASETIVESTDEETKATPRSGLGAVDSEHETSNKDGCNVVCTDAENNQVLLKVVTIHEPTIARVESDHPRKRIVKSGGSVPPVAATKENRPPSKCPASIARKSESRKEHTYVNVFTGSKRAPIYENYKPIESSGEKKIPATTTTDGNSGAEGGSGAESKTLLKSREIDDGNFDRVNAAVSNAASATASGAAEGKFSSGTESDRPLVGGKKPRNRTKETKSSRAEGSSSNVTSHSAASSRGRVGKQVTKNPTPRSSLSSSERADTRLTAPGNCLHASGNNTSVSKSSRDVASAKTTNKADALTKRKPIEVVYQTAVYNMKNEKLKKPPKGKESKGPRYLNELICGAKIKRPNDSKSGKTSSVTQHGANTKSALPPIKHWK